LAARTDVAVKWIWDHDPVRANKHVDALKAKVANTVGDICGDPEVDGVIICSETIRHESLVMSVVKARKHLFVEKPLGFKAKDALKMAGAIEKAKLIFQTGYFMRGNPVHLFLKEHIQKGTFGKITRIRHTNCHAGSLKGWFDTDWRWMADPKIAGCGAFGDLGTHSLDILLWLMGEVKEVTATIDVGTARYANCDEFGEGLLKFKNGAVGSIAAGWVDVTHPVSCIVSGTEAHAAVVNGQLFFQCEKIAGADGKTPWTALPEAEPHAFQLFLDKVVGKTAQLVGAKEAAYRNQVMEALYLGAQKKKWVSI
ncbi:MAG: Gfo/Idh/MocA family oxidoreductase, partial [Spirochaetia bacterium]|nr:Gfo/Idh/MocA family oxidoreductase [Spirochaetia bacterium]